MKTKIIIAFAILLVSNLVNGQNYATINVDSAYNLVQANILNPDFIILDVRTINEYNSKHIENGVEFDYNMPNFSTYLDTLIKDKIYLIHCASGSRSSNTFNLMQTMGFTDVYNMSGGINTWESSGYPVTTMVAPILLPVSDTLVNFVDITTISDTILIIITNYGNDTLKFDSITDLSSTEFSANFNLNTKITGIMDYTFSIVYTPTDSINDSTIFTIYCNTDTLDFYLKGNKLPVFVENNIDNEFKIYPNPASKFVQVESRKFKVESYEVYNIAGRRLITMAKPNMFLEPIRINIEVLPKGIYIIRIQTEKGMLTKKFIKY